MSVRRITFLGLPLDVDVDTQMVCNMLCDKATPRRVAFVNPYAWAVAKKDSNYLLALSNMSLVLADGEGVACACRLLSADAPCSSMRGIQGPSGGAVKARFSLRAC